MLKFKDASGNVKFLLEDADTQPSDIEKLVKMIESDEPETEEEEEKKES
jgi:hypothetical protein